MADGVDEVEGVLATEIAPPTRPRDHRGQPIRETAHPESLFSERYTEGDPLTGDTRDGGDDPALAAREKEIADGYEVSSRSLTQADQDRAERNRSRVDERSRSPDADDEFDVPDSDPENISAEGDEPDSERLETTDQQDDDSQKYEVVIDGQTHEVTLNEALNGYVRQATFHQRMAQVHDAARSLEEDYGRLQQGWAMWNKARQDYEEDVANMLPSEPNWDQEFARDPRAAYDKRKTFEIIYGKLQASQAARANREAAAQQELDRRTHKYAVDGFSRFVMDHIKVMPDEPTLRKNIQSMRRTAAAAGFSELEIATVYDPRMLDVLWKASKYDRMTANKPQAVVQSRGRSMAPGAATPFGNARRNSVDDAQRQLAKTGKVSDAAEVFRRLF